MDSINLIPLTNEEIAYVAGLFDGEGCVNLQMNSTKKHGELTACLSNNHVGILKFIQSAFGGRITRINHKYTPEWRCEAQKACSFFKIILPYLRIKKSQAELAIIFQGTVVKNRKGVRNNVLPEGILEKRRTICDLVKQEKVNINNKEMIYGAN